VKKISCMARMAKPHRALDGYSIAFRLDHLTEAATPFSRVFAKRVGTTNLDYEPDLRSVRHPRRHEAAAMDALPRARFWIFKEIFYLVGSALLPVRAGSSQPRASSLAQLCTEPLVIPTER
jgi:hypothetical protein